SRRCHVINLQIGSSAGLQTRTRTLAAGTPPVQPVRRPAVLIRADPRFWPTLFGMSRRIWIVAFAACVLGFVGAPLRAQWQILNSGTTADLRGIDNVGGGVAWASGTNGTVLRTEDGGYLWQPCTVPPGAEKLDFRGIQAFDANTAIVMSSGTGDLSRLYKTTDGCQTWKLLFTNPDKDGFWDAMKLSNPNGHPSEGESGIILGDPVGGRFTIEWTNDSGDTWKRLSIPPSLLGEGAFAASNSALFAEWEDGIEVFGTGGPTGARMFTTCDPCATKPFDKEQWHVQPMPMFGKGASVGVFSIAAKLYGPSGSYIAVGGDYSKPDSPGTAAYSKKWLVWHAAQTPPHGYRSAVAYDEATKTWITVGPNGTDVSIDDGRNWRAVHPDTEMHEAADADGSWNALSLPYVVGPHGRIGKLEKGSF
ncbi:MAG: hypothetical protein WAL75_19525, partial [Terracidiphilus sp.]